MMLDPKRTFDELIEAIAPTPERAEEIKANRVYRSLSTAVAGSQEFTAVSKLYELAHERDFDLLVLDTPPSRNAIDFFEAPRPADVLPGGPRAARVPAADGHRDALAGARRGTAAARRCGASPGVEMVTDLSLFFQLLGDMTEDFSARAAEVQRLLRAPETAFVLVTSAQSEPIDEAIWLRHTLSETGLPFGGVVVNRFHHDLADDGGDRTMSPALPKPRRAAGGERRRELRGLLRARTAATPSTSSGWRRDMKGEPLLLVPQFDDDVHDIDGLLRVHAYLFASDEERAG